MPFDRHRSLGYVVNRLGRLLARALERRLSEFGVPMGQFPVLLILWEEEGLTQTEIARRLNFEQPTIANTLKRMERDGLVTTAPDPTSQRRVLVFLTERARGLETPLTAAAQGINRRVCAKLPPQDVQALFSTMAKLAGELEDELEEAGRPAPAADEDCVREETVPP